MAISINILLLNIIMMGNMKRLIIILCLLIFLILPVYGMQINAGDGTIIISSGDIASITGQITDNSKSGYAWLYTGNYNSLMYGEPITVIGNTYKINVNKSISINEGKYKMFIQFAGPNNIQEVLYNKETGRLYSPWRFVKDLDVSNNIAATPSMIEQFCLDNIKYCDDTFVNTTVIVEGPFIKLSDQYQTQDNERDITKNGLLYVGGTTNIDSSNKINVTLDYIQTVAATIESQNPYGYYTWHAYLNITKLRSGDHTILIQSNKLADLKHILTISEYIPTPTPTPTPVRYVRNNLKEFISVPNTPTVKVTPTPIIINSSNQKFIPIITATPKPGVMVMNTPSVFTPTPLPTTKKTPMDIMIMFGGIAMAIIIFNTKVNK